MNTLPALPLLDDAEAAAWEARILQGDEQAAWEAMNRAGEGIAELLARDLALAARRNDTATLRILALLGKGNNAGDALVALRALRANGIAFEADLCFAFGQAALRPAAQRALKMLLESGLRMRAFDWDCVPGLPKDSRWDVCLDGIFGLSFRPPLPPEASALIDAVNRRNDISLRAAVDYPSGLCDATLGDSKATVFKADFTYQTGIPKKAVLHPACIGQTGRLRLVDIGFFDRESPDRKTESILLEKAVIRQLRALRAAECDKRDFGHCIVLSGSRDMPGAHLMNVRAALASGAGLVSAFCPPETRAAFCAQAPAAMWSAFEENTEGGATMATADRILKKLSPAHVLLTGSGMGRFPDTQALLARLVREAPCPMALDADALTAEVLEALGSRPPEAPACLLTPHMGEYARLNPQAVHGDLPAFCRKFNVITVLKGPRTRICSQDAEFINICGSPALARGGSGDVLAGLMAGLLAQTPKRPMEAACKAVVWHAAASECAERALSQRAATTEMLLRFLPEALL